MPTIEEIEAKYGGASASSVEEIERKYGGTDDDIRDAVRKDIAERVAQIEAKYGLIDEDEKRRTGLQKRLRGLVDIAEGAVASGAAPILGQAKKAAEYVPKPVKAIGRTLIDVLSRTGYAMAGAVEEMGRGIKRQGWQGAPASITAAVSRAAEELKSSPLAEKRAFTEVYENLGMPTYTLADALPFMEGTWIGQMGTRGALGLGSDIIVDPINLVGGGVFRKVLTSAGEIGLTKAGMAARNEVLRVTAGLAKGKIAAAKADDALLGTVVSEGIEKEVLRDANDRFARMFPKATNPKFYDKGGLKIAGTTVVPGSVGSSVKSHLADVIRKLPGGEATLEGSDNWFNSARALVTTWGDSGLLPDKIVGPDGVERAGKPLAIWHARNFASTRAAIAQRLKTVLHRGLESEDGQVLVRPGGVEAFRRAVKKDPGAAKRIHFAAEELDDTLHADRMAKLSPDERHAAESGLALGRMMRDTLIRSGLLEEGDLPVRWLPHAYENIDEWVQAGGKPTKRPVALEGSLKSDFLKERVFETYEEAETVSKRLSDLTAKEAYAARAQGALAPMAVELKPSYAGYADNFEATIDRYADVLARRGWQEQLYNDFGIPAWEWDINTHWQMGRPLATTPVETAIINRFSGGLQLSTIGVPQFVKAIVEPGVRRSLRGFYTTAEKTTPRSMLGLKSKALRTNPNAKVLTVEIGRTVASPTRHHRPVSQSSGIGALRNLRGDGYTDLVLRSSKADAVAMGMDVDPSVKWTQYKDSYEIAETIGAIEARRSGYEAILGRSANSPEVEYVGLSRKAFSGEKNTPEARFRQIVGEGPQKDIDQARALLNATMGQLSDRGKRELLRRLLSRTKSRGEMSELVDAVKGENLANWLPPTRDIPPGAKDALLEARFGPGHGDYVKVPQTGVWKGVEGYLPRRIITDFEKANSTLWATAPKEVRRILNGYDRATNLWRWSVYGAWRFGASGVRNLYSSAVMGYYDVGMSMLNPLRRAQSAEVMVAAQSERAMKALGHRTIDLGEGGRHAVKDLVERAHAYGVIAPGKGFVEPSGAQTLGRRPAKFLDIMNLPENEARMAIWLENMRRGLHPREAADHVADFAFNYGELSQVERSIIRRLVGFPTFMRKNFELHMRTLAKNPGRVVNSAKWFRGRHEENEQLISWESEAYKIRLNRDGKTLRVVTGIDLPVRALDTFWKGDSEKTIRGGINILLPWLRVPVEIGANRSMLTGRPLTRRESFILGTTLEKAHTPPSIMRIMRHEKTVDEAGRVKHTFDERAVKGMLESYIFSRLFSTSERQYREYLSGDNPSMIRGILDLVTGLRRKDLNLDEQQEKILQERIRLMEEQLLRSTDKVREYRNVYVPKEK